MKTLEPGQAYMYKSGRATTFNYADKSVSTARSRYARGLRSRAPWTVASVHKYHSQMSVIAVLDGLDASEYIVGALDADGECRGVAVEVNGRLFMSIGGNGGERIHFMAVHRDSGEEVALSGATHFVPDVLGSLDAPYMLHLVDADDMGSVQADVHGSDVYDLSGRKAAVTRRKGVYISGGRKVVK